MHRNLRPSNILLSPSLSVTITDFSLAYLHHIPTPIQRGHLCLRNAVGSVEYLAPEILSRRGYDNMVDYWALGILMFEILRGRVGSRLFIFLSLYEPFRPIVAIHS
jgi:serine/threonine protein kinase